MSTWISVLSAFVFVFFFTATATPEIYTLSLHDALPIFGNGFDAYILRAVIGEGFHRDSGQGWGRGCAPGPSGNARSRSEEHTSELQSRFDLVCRLLLEKKKYSA